MSTTLTSFQVERELGTDDHGADVESAEKLIKRHDDLCKEIETKESLVRETVEKANKLRSVVSGLILVFMTFLLICDTLSPISGPRRHLCGTSTCRRRPATLRRPA